MIRKAKYRGIPCMFNDATNELTAYNWVYNKLIDLNLWIDTRLLVLDEFPLWVEMTEDEINEYKKSRKL